MYKFFINRPIVAMVIAILMVIIGAVSMVSLPVAQFPNIVPPEIRIQTTFLGGDAQTLALSSPNGTHDATFLANYAYINLVDQITQLKGISNINVFGAGQYAMRFWVKPDQLAKLNLTVNDILNAINAQNNANPAGQVGGPPTPHGQEFTYAITAQGRLVSEKQFEEIIVRENSDGSIVRLKDVARVELGA